MGLGPFEGNSDLSSPQSTNADTKGCRDAAAWFCLAKSNREHEQLCSCAPGTLGGRPAHPRARRPHHRRPRRSVTALTGKPEAASKARKLRGNGRTGRMDLPCPSVDMIKTKNIPNSPEKSALSRFPRTLTLQNPPAPNQELHLKSHQVSNAIQWRISLAC